MEGDSNVVGAIFYNPIDRPNETNFTCYGSKNQERPNL